MNKVEKGEQGTFPTSSVHTFVILFFSSPSLPVNASLSFVLKPWPALSPQFFLLYPFQPIFLLFASVPNSTHLCSRLTQWTSREGKSELGRRHQSVEAMQKS